MTINCHLGVLAVRSEGCTGASGIADSKHILIVGAGHGHLNVIRDAHRWPDSLRVTVLAPREFWYSGLATGMLGGQFDVAQDCIDVADLCRRTGVEFIEGRMASLDAQARIVRAESGQSLRYDVASLNLGSEPLPLEGATPDGQRVFTVKPLRMLADLRRRLETRRGQRIVIVGGGYSGSECALNLARLPGRHRLTLITRSSMPATELPHAARRQLATELRKAGVDVRTRTAAARVEDQVVVMDSGDRVPFDILLIATGLRPPALTRDLGLAADHHGHLLIDECLRCIGRDNLFAVGDAAEIRGHEPLPKIGVTAVFQGRMLRHNLPAAALGRPLWRYRPRRHTLLILNLGNGSGLATYGPLHWRGRLSMWLKTTIDLNWLDSFQAG